LVLDAHSVRRIVLTIFGPLKEVAVGFRIGGDVVMNFWSCRRQHVVFVYVAGVEQAHLVKDFLSSLSLRNPFCKLDLVRCFIKPLHPAMLELAL
jgi:hypothetical protein